MSGIQWIPSDGKVSTMSSGKKVWVAAAEVLSEELGKSIAKEKNWRNMYPQNVTALADLQAGATDENAFKSAEAGIAATLKQFHFVRGDTTHPLDALPTGEAFSIKTICCGGHNVSAKLAPACSVQVGTTEITDPAKLVDAIEGWVRYGSAEPSCAAHVKELLALQEGQFEDFLQSHMFVILGGTSAAGPTLPLLKMGARVAVIARPGKKLKDLIATVSTAEYKGVMFVPSLEKDGAEVLGADVLTQTPEIAALLPTLTQMNSVHTAKVDTLVIGSYIYLDGEAHVRATVACDIIAQKATSALPNKVKLAFIGTPSLAFGINKEAYEESKARYENESFLGKMNPMRLLKYKPNARPVVKNAKGDVYVTNGLIAFQGPNYALAKTFQSWRIMLCRKNGQVASANVAPPMYTESVCHVPAAYAALNGYQGHPPMSAFDPQTISPIMTYLMMWDLWSKDSTAQPTADIGSSINFFAQNAFHGGSWRCAYEQESMGASVFLLGKCWYTSKPELPPSA